MFKFIHLNNSKLLKMKRILLIIVFVNIIISCNSGNTNPVTKPSGDIELKKAGEWVSTGDKHMIGTDDDVMMVKSLIDAFDTMNVDQMFEFFSDEIMWYAASEKEGTKVDKDFMTNYLSQYDSVSVDVRSYLPYKRENSDFSIVQVGSTEKRYPKDGEMETERLIEKFFIRDGKIYAVRGWSAQW